MCSLKKHKKKKKKFIPCDSFKETKKKKKKSKANSRVTGLSFFESIAYAQKQIVQNNKLFYSRREIKDINVCNWL